MSTNNNKVQTSPPLPSPSHISWSYLSSQPFNFPSQPNNGDFPNGFLEGSRQTLNAVTKLYYASIYSIYQYLHIDSEILIYIIEFISESHQTFFMLQYSRYIHVSCIKLTHHPQEVQISEAHPAYAVCTF